MKEVRLKSTILLPLPEYTKGLNFRWIDTTYGKRGNITEEADVIAFNTKNKTDFKPLLEKDLASLKAAEEQTDNVKNQIAYIEKLLKELDQPEMHHDAPFALLNAIYYFCCKRFTAKQVVYLSGVVL